MKCKGIWFTLFCLGILLFCGFTSKAASNVDIIIEEYTLAEDTVPGEDTVLTVKFRNVSNLYAAEGIIVSFSSTNNSVIPVEGRSNQIYLDKISPQTSSEVDIPIVVVGTNGYANMSFSVTYSVREERKTNNSYIIFPISDEKALEIENVNVVFSATKGVASLVGVIVNNPSTEAVQDVTLQVKRSDGSLLLSSELGTLMQDQSKYFEEYVSYPEAGTENITLTITYHDSKGRLYSVDGGTYSVSVKEPNEDTEYIIQDEEATQNQGLKSDTKIQLFIAIICLIFVLILVSVFALLRKKGR